MTDTGQSKILTGWQARLARTNFDKLQGCAHLDPTGALSTFV